MQTATGLLDIEPAARATLPVALPGGLHEQQVLPRALPLTEPRKLLTCHAGVPRHPAPRAEEPAAPVALGLGDALLAVVVGHHHLRAIRKRAVGAARAEEQGLAELGAPALEDFGGERATAELRIERGSAGRVGAPHHGAAAAALELGPDVAGQARGAECVRAGGAAAVGRGGRHGLHADAAGVVLLRPIGSRHSAVGGAGKGREGKGSEGSRCVEPAGIPPAHRLSFARKMARRISACNFFCRIGCGSISLGSLGFSWDFMGGISVFSGGVRLHGNWEGARSAKGCMQVVPSWNSSYFFERLIIICPLEYSQIF